MKLLLVALAALTLSASPVAFADPSPSPVPTTEVSKADSWNDILKENSQEVLKWAKESAEKTADFAAAQTPLYIQEYLAWQFWSNSLKYVILVLVTGSSLVLAFIVGNKAKWGSSDTVQFSNIVTIVSGFVGVLCLCACFINLDWVFNAVEVKVAPRVVLVEQLAKTIHDAERW